MIVPVFMLGTALIVPFRDIIPTYAGPNKLTIDQLPNDLAPLQVDYGRVMRLIGFRLPTDQAASGTLDFTLYWQCLTQSTADFSAFIIVYGRNQSEVGKRDAYPFHGLFATSQCTPGMVFADPYRVSIAADADRPTVLRVQVGLKDWQHTLELVPSIGHQPMPALIIIAGRLSPVAINPAVPHKSYARLGAHIELDTGSIPTQIRPGESLTIDFHWRALSAPPESYTVFAHLLDEQGHMLAQSDGLPVNGDYPTNWWVSGEMIVDEHRIKLPPDLPIGSYRVAIGLYRLADNTRLPVVDDLGQVLPDDQFIWPQVIQIQN